MMLAYLYTNVSNTDGLIGFAIYAVVVAIVFGLLVWAAQACGAPKWLWVLLVVLGALIVLAGLLGNAAVVIRQV